MSDINPHWDKFILWLATPTSERIINNEEEWAKEHGYSNARTLRRWKQNPQFLDRQKSMAQSLAKKTNATMVYDNDEITMDSEERDYRLVKSKLVESAKNGNLKAQEQYMKLYGKSWIDEEMSARQSDYSNYELPELISQAMLVLDLELVAEALRDKGYEVKKI